MNGLQSHRRTARHPAGRRIIPLPQERPGIPEDLRGWLPESDLIRLVLEAVTGPELGSDRLSPLREGDEWFAPSLLLSLLTYSYATGRFGSDEVETNLKADSALAYLATRRWPPAVIFRRFRRRHREVLTRVLSRVLASGLRGRPAGMDVSRLSTTEEPVPSAVLEAIAQEDARRRVQRAVLEDAVAADV